VRHPRPEELVEVERLFGPQAAQARRLPSAPGQQNRWLLTIDGRIAAAAWVVPSPGLPGELDLDGFVGPERRRQGLGSRLLAQLAAELAESGTRRLVHRVDDLGGAAGRFLAANGFAVDHDELRLAMALPVGLDSPALPAGFRVSRGRSRPAAASAFRRLYDAAFRGLPWYQPYEGQDEVLAELAEPEELLFLVRGRRPVGFLWLRRPSPDHREIEPLGIVPEFRGSGLGRALLLAGLSRAAAEGARTAEITAWQINTPALRLYRSVGFRPAGRSFILARDLSPGS
jgi:mycothiol synthase